MPNLLSAIYSEGDRIKRHAKSLLADPIGYAQQYIGALNDGAGRGLGLLAESGAPTGRPTQEQQQARNALIDVLGPAMMGATVWHGSPYTFSKFDSSKIGSGEGAQAYGHGLYLAESPEVAKNYATDLARPKVQDSTRLGRSIQSEIDRVFSEHGQHATNMAHLEGHFQKLAEPYSSTEDVGNAFFDMVRDGRIRFDKNLYKVDLPDSAIAKMLDWDKPLSQQPNVLKALEGHPTMGRESAGWRGAPAGMYERAYRSPSQTGEWLYREIANNDPAASVDAMRALGIPGIRYLDGGSRGAGAGSSNFVVFPGEESLLTILERNGVPIR